MLESDYFAGESAVLTISELSENVEPVSLSPVVATRQVPAVSEIKEMELLENCFGFGSEDRGREKTRLLVIKSHK